MVGTDCLFGGRGYIAVRGLFRRNIAARAVESLLRSQFSPRH